ncbi:MAG: HlyD family efflux transporter periplasmic adaptor subunit [Phycisphaerales bacterium]|nr:HlyD family efflux transporter periplasmic adaptor subunit [Phycisphaerales bacterium]
MAWLLSRQCRLAPAKGGVILRGTDQSTSPEIIAIWPELPDGSVAPDWVGVAARASSRLRTQAAHPSGQPSWFVMPIGQHVDDESPHNAFVVAQILGDPNGVETPRSFAGFLVHGSRSEVGIITERLSAGWLQGELRAMRDQLAAESLRARRCALAMDLAAGASHQTRLMGFATALCDQAAAILKCERVCVGLGTGWRHDGRSVRLLAMSHTERIVRGAQSIQQIELAMEECVDQDSEVFVSSDGPIARGCIDRAARDLLQNSSGGVLALPIRTRATTEDGPIIHIPGLTREHDQAGDYRVRGALLLERHSGPFIAEEIESLRAALDILSPRLIQLAAGDRWPGVRLAAMIRSGIATLLGPRHTWLKLAVVLLLGLAAFALFAKGTYRVECAFKLEAVSRQIVPAPFDGFLREVHVRVGDEVVKGQTILARIDDTQLRLQAAEAQAELATHERDLAVARQEGKTAESQIAQAQAEKIRARIELLDDQIGRAAIIAPMTGVLVVGDLERTLGAPVQTGQTLFEIAPLARLRADLSVPEDQIGDVKLGQIGTLASTAIPSRRIPFTVERIDPIAQVVDQDNNFRVQVRIDATEPWMRPGMEGVAKVDVEQRAYANIWSRRLVNWVRMKLWL